jgi:hypothetical protein
MRRISERLLAMAADTDANLGHAIRDQARHFGEAMLRKAKERGSEGWTRTAETVAEHDRPLAITLSLYVRCRRRPDLHSLKAHREAEAAMGSLQRLTRRAKMRRRDMGCVATSAARVEVSMQPCWKGGLRAAFFFGCRADGGHCVTDRTSLKPMCWPEWSDLRSRTTS